MRIALDGSVLDGVILAIKQTTRFGDQKIALETRLTCDLALGGFGRLKLAICLEEIFDVELSDDVLEQAVTVADIVKYIGGHYCQDTEHFQQSRAA